VSQRYDVRGVPTLIVFKDRQQKDRIEGGTSKEAISRIMDTVFTRSAG